MFQDNPQFRDDESFLESGILDSTGVLQLIEFLEETYAVKVEDAEMIPENLDSIDKIVVYLRGKSLTAEDQEVLAAETMERRSL